jgi:glycosyltransferase involved in cell wall biosynthesis
MNEPRVGYILKQYPRLSETFILNEILAHEAAGLHVHIFSLHLPNETFAHDEVARVRARVDYLPNIPITLREIGKVLIEVSDMLDPEDCAAAIRDSKSLQLLWQASRIAAIAQSADLTHLHAHFATDPAWVARIASILAGLPYSFTAHAKDIFHESVDSTRLRKLARDASGIVTVSDFNVSYLQDILGADACPIHRIYNGLDLADFPYCRAEREPGLVVAVGRLVEKKGFDVLVRACEAMRASGHEFRCVIIGEGNQTGAIRALIESAQLGDRVSMLGALPRSEVKGWVSRASVFAAPCVVGADGNRDGLPTVLLEAMALGTPCISTPVTGIPEIVREGETGLLVPERDPVALAAALWRLLEDRGLARSCAEAARRQIEESFDLHANTKIQRELFA